MNEVKRRRGDRIYLVGWLVGLDDGDDGVGLDWRQSIFGYGRRGSCQNKFIYVYERVVTLTGNGKPNRFLKFFNEGYMYLFDQKMVSFCLRINEKLRN
jgi:hypothetical protein